MTTSVMPHEIFSLLFKANATTLKNYEEVEHIFIIALLSNLYFEIYLYLGAVQADPFSFFLDFVPGSIAHEPKNVF